MRFAKIFYDNKARWCQVVDGEYYELKNSIYDDIPQLSASPIRSPEKIRLLAPCDACKVIALAYNYKGLVGEKKSYDEPLVFFKSLSGLVGHKALVIYPSFGKKVWQEVELAIVIKIGGKNIPVDKASDHILGYTCGNDVTCENILSRDWHLARSKGLDTFCPLGPYLVKGLDTSQLRLKSYINGRISQDSTTADRIMNDQEAVALASRYFSLSPGDVILTGSPAGATDAVISPGDVIKVEIESIGALMNNVVKEES